MQELKSLIKDLSRRVNAISADRKELLNALSKHIVDQIRDKGHCNLLVVCTHNSRRSQLAELWLNVLSAQHQLSQIRAYSCGTEATQFNANMINAVSASGFVLHKTTHCENPIYRLDTDQSNSRPVIMLSKTMDHPSLPRENVIAIMVCDHADQNCPVIEGCDVRYSLPYSDPKQFDEDPTVNQKYQEKVEEIGIEMIYLINKTKTDLQQ